MLRVGVRGLLLHVLLQAYLIHYEAILHGRNSMLLQHGVIAEILPVIV